MGPYLQACAESHSLLLFSLLDRVTAAHPLLEPATAGGGFAAPVQKGRDTGMGKYMNASLPAGSCSLCHCLPFLPPALRDSEGCHRNPARRTSHFTWAQDMAQR